MPRPTRNTPSNAEIEERWIDAWNALDEIIGDRWNVRCLLSEGQVVSVDECQGWLQDSVYDGWRVKVEPGWVFGKQGVIASRWRDEAEGD